MVLSKLLDPKTGISDVVIVSISGGPPRSLGKAVDYAGDPQQAGALVTVPAPSRIQRTSDKAFVVTAVEHRVGGGATTTVVTTAQLANELKQLGLGESDRMGMDVSPDPTGKTLAVVPRDVRSGQALAVFVYTRVGKLVAYTPATPSSAVFWSPSGKQLLFSATNGAQVWTLGQPPQTIPLPNNATLLGNCVWAPDGTQVACAGYPGIGKHYDAWVLFDITHHAAHAYPAAGLPVFWEK